MGKQLSLGAAAAAWRHPVQGWVKVLGTASAGCLLTSVANTHRGPLHLAAGPPLVNGQIQDLLKFPGKGIVLSECEQVSSYLFSCSSHK